MATIPLVSLSEPLSRGMRCRPRLIVAAAREHRPGDACELVGERDRQQNVSERALRPSVIFRKVTNGFRSEWGAKVYADLCSIVGTGRRTGRSPLEAIRNALAPA